MSISSQFFHLSALIKKNLKMFFRDRTMFILTFLSPLVIIGLFTWVANINIEDTTWNVGVVNYDDAGFDTTVLDPCWVGSADFIETIKKLEIQTDRNHIDFNITIFSPEYHEIATEMSDNGQFDLLIIIPANFSECLIGNTWWYKSLLYENFTNVEYLLTQYDIDEYYSSMITQTMFNPNLPTNGTVELELYAGTNYQNRLIINVFMQDLIQNMINAYNNLNTPEIYMKYNNGIKSEELSPYEIYLPFFMGLICLFPIASISIQVLKEKDLGTFLFVDTTYSSKYMNSTSILLTQLMVSSLEICFLMLIVRISNNYVHPDCNFFLLFLSLLLLVFVSSGIGLIIGVYSRTFGVAGILSFLIVFVMQMLSNMLLGDLNIIFKHNPLSYSNKAISKIILEGKSFLAISICFEALFIYGAIFLLIGLLSLKSMNKTRLTTIDGGL